MRVVVCVCLFACVFDADVWRWLFVCRLLCEPFRVSVPLSLCACLLVWLFLYVVGCLLCLRAVLCLCVCVF